MTNWVVVTEDKYNSQGKRVKGRKSEEMNDERPICRNKFWW
jgi:hypothetical protein